MHICEPSARKKGKKRRNDYNIAWMNILIDFFQTLLPGPLHAQLVAADPISMLPKT